MLKRSKRHVNLSDKFSVNTEVRTFKVCRQSKCNIQVTREIFRDYIITRSLDI